MPATYILPILLAALGTPEQQCIPLTGIVFDDADRDGYRSAGEAGLPGIRVQKVNGWTAVTDEDGRFRLNCAELTTGLQRSSIIVELDTKSLPLLYEMTTESMMVVTLEAGKAETVEFGVVLDEVHLTLWGNSFVNAQSSLTPESKRDLDKVVSLLREGRSDVELFYIDPDTNATLAHQRIEHVEKTIVKRWQHEGCYHEITIHSWAPKRLSATPL